jgi:hypothetical protein
MARQLPDGRRDYWKTHVASQGDDAMKPMRYVDVTEAARLRDYADQLDLLGKSAMASMWREMADRIEAGGMPPVTQRRTRIWFDQRNAPSRSGGLRPKHAT